MLDVIRKLLQNLEAAILAAAGEWVTQAAFVVRSFLSLDALKMSLKYPGLPYVFELFIDLGLATFDLIMDVLTVTPFQAVAATLLDFFKAPGKLRQKVLTLDQASILVARVIVNEGIKSAADPLPQEWQTYELVSRVEKIDSMIRRPTLRSAWKLLMGSLWGRVVRILLLVFTWGKLLGLTMLLWKWTKLVMQESAWPLIFSGALRQDNPRVTEHVVIQRRTGGVPP